MLTAKMPGPTATSTEATVPLLPHPWPSSPLASLPVELLSHVLHHVDQRTATRLARAARAFTSVSADRIWEELDLSQAAFTEERTIDQWYKDHQDEDIDIEDEREARKARLVQTLESVLAQGDSRRWCRVEKMTISSHCTQPIMDILRYTAPYLRSLIVHAGCHLDERHGHMYWPDDGNLSPNMLDARLLGPGIHFPTLTSVQLCRGSIGHAETLGVLCRLAPNLIHIDVDLNDTVCRLRRSSGDGDTDDEYPDSEDNSSSSASADDASGADAGVEAEAEDMGMPETTKIRTLSLRFSVSDEGGWAGAAVGWETGSYYNSDDEDEDAVEAWMAHPAIQILERSPLVERLTIDCGYEALFKVLNRVVKIASQYAHLKDLCWLGKPYPLLCRIERDGPGFLNIERLTLDSEGCDNLFPVIPPLSKLQSVHIVDRLHSQAASPSSDTAPAVGMVPRFAAGLRANPQLREFCTGEAVNSSIGGSIRSWIHGGEEVIHAPLVMRHVEVADTVAGGGWRTYRGPRQPPQCCRLRYLAHTEPTKIGSDGVTKYEGSPHRYRDKIYRQFPQSAIADLTDYQGSAVPLEVLERMRVVEGMELREWEQRGVHVGSEAWGVLLEWKVAHDKKVAPLKAAEEALRAQILAREQAAADREQAAELLAQEKFDKWLLRNPIREEPRRRNYHGFY